MLVADFISKVRHLYSETSTEYITDAVIVDYLNDGLKDWSKRKLYEKQASYDYSDVTANATTGLSEIELPSDFYDVKRVLLDEEKVTKIPYSEIAVYIENEQQKSYVRDNYLGFVEALTSDSEVVLEYYAYHPTITTPSTDPIFVDILNGSELMFVHYVVAQLCMDDLAPDERNIHYAIYMNLLNQYTTDRRRVMGGKIAFVNTATSIDI